ncbi:MAG: hypothetical protein PHS14_07690 [Elusimicrobia bacterium]|nr:hypothetical protein [Elusimicrobiota bacterium]
MTTLLDEIEGPRKRYQIIAVVFLLAFIYKVWNERHMTGEYHDWVVETRRSAAALERIAYEAEERHIHAGAGRPAQANPKQLTAKENGELWTTCAPGVTGRIKDCAQVQKEMGIYPWPNVSGSETERARAEALDARPPCLEKRDGMWFGRDLESGCAR